RAALARLKGYKGEILARMRCSQSASGVQEPYEFHLLSFPTEAAFSSFVASGTAYQEERERSIAKTTILVGTSLPGISLEWTAISGDSIPRRTVGMRVSPPTDP